MRTAATDRPGFAPPPRFVQLPFLLAVLLSGATSAAQAAQETASIPLRLIVDATCSDAGAFMTELQKHAPRVRGTSGDEHAPTMQVAVRRNDEQFAGVLTVREPGEDDRHREVHDHDCASVVAGLAFVAAVIVDPDAALRGASTAGSSPGAARGLEPPAATETPPQPNPGTRSSSPGESASPEPRFRIGAGAAVEAARGLGPDTAFIPRLFAELEFPRLLGGAHARLSGGRGVSRSVATELGTAKIDLTDVRLDACVDAWSLTSFALGSCGVVDGLLLAGAGTNTADPRNADRLTVELGLALRPRWTIQDWITMELVVGAAAPLARYRFYFAPNATAYRLAAVSGFAEFAAGVRFR